MLHALIDADILIYAAACVHQKEFDWNPTGTPEDTYDVSRVGVHADLHEAIAHVDRKIEEILNAVGADSAIPCLSSSLGNFRKDLYPQYKSNRKDTVDPILRKPLTASVMASSLFVDILTIPCLEADDCLGVYQTEDTIICTIDKDLLQISGKHYNWRTEEVFEISPEEADMFFWTQCLTGDATDGYPGVPRIGPVKASKLLSGVTSEEEAWEVIKKAYDDKEISQEDALVQCRLARILRRGEYNWEKGAPILWTPASYVSK